MELDSGTFTVFTEGGEARADRCGVSHFGKNFS
jgi:hypothetical protein